MRGEIIQDLSSPYTKNKVYLINSDRHGEIIRKVFDHPVYFKREVEALKKVDRALHPAIYKIDMRRRHIYMSYDPVQNKPENIDEVIAALMKKLHNTTKTYKGVFDPGSGWNAPSWKDYLQIKGTEWINSLKGVKDYTNLFHELLLPLNDSGFAPVSLVHRDIRLENIGQRSGNYILFDYELAIWGDPYWDVARYALQSASSKNDFFEMYGIKDRDKAETYIRLFALSFAAYLADSKQTDNQDFEKCISVLN